MKKIFKLAGFLLLPIAIFLLILLLNWKSLSYYFIETAARYYAGRADIALDFGRISGDPLAEITIDNVRLRPADGQPQAYHFRAQSLTCSYGLGDLRKGLAGFIQRLDCTAQGPDFSYDLGVASGREQPEGEAVSFTLPAFLPGLALHDGAVVLIASSWEVKAAGINSRLHSPAEGAHDLQIQVESFQFKPEGAAGLKAGFSAALRYEKDKLTINSLEIGEEEISATGFIELAPKDNGLREFAVDLAFARSQLQLTGSLDRQILRAQLRIDDFDVSELQKRLGGFGWDVAAVVRGNISLAYDLESEQNSTGSFAFEVDHGRLQGVEIGTVSLSGSLDQEIFHIALAEARSSDSHMIISDLSVPLSLLRTGEPFSILAGSRAKFRMQTTDFASYLQLFNVEEDNVPEAFRLQSVNIDGYLDNGALYLDDAGGKAASLEVRIDRAEIPIPSDAQAFAAVRLNISAAEIRTPGNHIGILEASVPLALLQKGEVLTNLAASRAEFELALTDFAALLHHLHLETGKLPEIARLKVLTLQGRLQEATIYLESGRAETADAHLIIDRAKIPLPVDSAAFKTLPVQLAARFTSSSPGGLALIFSDISAGGQVAAEVDITGTMQEPQGKIKITGKELRIKDMPIGSLALQGEVQFVQETPGRIQSGQLQVTELTQTNGSGQLSLAAPAAATWQHGRMQLQAPFRLEDRGEALLKIDQTDKEITVQFETHGLGSEGWLRNFIDERYFFHGADITFVVTGLPDNPQMKLAGSVGRTGGAEMAFPMAGNFDLQYSSMGIRIAGFTWESPKGMQLSLAGFLPYDPLAPEPFLDGSLSLQGFVDIPSLEDVAGLLEPWGISKGAVVLDMDVSGSWSKPEGRIRLQVEDLDPPAALREYTGSTLDFSGNLAAEGSSIILQEARLESAGYTARGSASWQHGFSVRELLRDHKAELQGEVAADVEVKFRDLNFLRKKLPWLRRFEGDMQGELHLSGPVADPAIVGSFLIRDGEISHTFNFPKFSRVSLQGFFDGRSINIEDMRAELGGSPVNLKGSINREQEIVAVDLQVAGKNVLLFRNNDMQMRGDIQLNVSGPLTSLAINGTTGLTGGYYTRNIDLLSKVGSSPKPVSAGAGFLFSFSDPPLKNAVFDIKITTIEPFRIRNNLIRGVLRPELTLKGTGELPYLAGTIYIDPSRVLLPSGRLQVQSGLVRFLEEEPDRPQLDLLAQSKVLGYDINVVIRGPMDDPVVTLSSNPALPNDELLLLLLTGQPPQQDLAGGTKSTATTNVMVYLGRDFLNRWLEEDAGTGDETILDRFELDFGREVTRTGEQTVEATFRLSELESGKRKVYYLTAEKDKYDAYNYGLKLVFRFE